MRIAFYAPLKPPTHETTSGDRRVARLFVAALQSKGHRVELASIFRSRDGAGDAARQARLAAIGDALAGRLLRRYRAAPDDERPEAWFTYHLYDKAPDWIGPRVADELRIPYVVAEASLTPSRANGPWSAGHASVLAALGQAARVIGLNPADTACVKPALARSEAMVALAPFIDTAPYAAAADNRPAHRAACAAAHRLDAGLPWLLAVGMMRAGDKAASFRALAAALARIRDRDWQILLVGDGPARPEIEAAFAEFGDRVRWAGAFAPEALPAVYAACDLMVWPAVREAFGMALLEAQAAGLPVVAGRGIGVEAVVADGLGGLLLDDDDAGAMAGAVAALLDDPERRRSMGRAARAEAASKHDIIGAAWALDHIFTSLGAAQ